jgi:hypothetical protein
MLEQNLKPAHITASNLCFKKGALFGEIEGFETATQDRIKNKKIIKYTVNYKIK